MLMFDWKKFFNIGIDSAPADERRDRIESDSTVTGANLVILIAAILIACVGLNMDSTAVIIGAMLISPLMGGLVAVSYGMATYNLHFLKSSMVKLFFQIVFSLLTAAIYFALTPITIPTAEMAARTSPTIWDVLIALCGGIAGAVGNTRTVKTNVIPGVAIATALMPPLCTAGYGIAMRTLLHRGSLPLLHQRLLYHALRLLHLQTSGRPHERNDFTGALPFPAPYPAAPWHRHYHTKHLHGRYDRP